MLTSIFRIVFIRNEKSFVSKQGQPQPHIHSEASVLKGHNCKMVYCRVTVATLFHDNDLFPSIFNIVFFFSFFQHYNTTMSTMLTVSTMAGCFLPFWLFSIT